jgi:hypothetical protein
MELLIDIAIWSAIVAAAIFLVEIANELRSRRRN